MAGLRASVTLEPDAPPWRFLLTLDRGLTFPRLTEPTTRPTGVVGALGAVVTGIVGVTPCHGHTPGLRTPPTPVARSVTL